MTTSSQTNGPSQHEMATPPCCNHSWRAHQGATRGVYNAPFTTDGQCYLSESVFWAMMQSRESSKFRPLQSCLICRRTIRSLFSHCLKVSLLQSKRLADVQTFLRLCPTNFQNSTFTPTVWIWIFLSGFTKLSHFVCTNDCNTVSVHIWTCLTLSFYDEKVSPHLRARSLGIAINKFALNEVRQRFQFFFTALLIKV